MTVRRICLGKRGLPPFVLLLYCGFLRFTVYFGAFPGLLALFHRNKEDFGVPFAGID